MFVVLREPLCGAYVTSLILSRRPARGLAVEALTQNQWWLVAFAMHHTAQVAAQQPASTKSARKDYGQQHRKRNLNAGIMQQTGVGKI